jgi:hypothetical protein
MDLKNRKTRETIRKLQGTDLEDDIIPNTYISDLPKEAENTTAEPETFTGDYKLPPAISTTSFNETTNTDSPVALQVRKFHKFEKKNKSIKFGLFLYYLNMPIAETVIMRLAIKYNTRRLRSLQSDQITGESTPTTCQIKNDFRNRIGKNGDGENIDYDCTAQTSVDTSKIQNVVLDPTMPMVVGKSAISFNDVEFTEDSKDGTQNLLDISSVPSGILDETTASMIDNKLIIKGILKPSDTLNQNQNFDLELYDLSNNEMKTVSCKVNEIKTNSGSCTIECDTVKTPLSTNLGNLTLAKSSNPEKLYLKINTDKSKDQNQLITSESINNSNVLSNKSSSGLSGGAIAGIVIACVAVLAAASIIAICLRRPKPVVDTTITVMGLQNGENI